MAGLNPRTYRTRLHRAGVAIVVNVFVLCAMGPARGASVTWTGAGATNVWSDGGNWSGGVPVDGDDLIFGAGARTTLDDLPALTLGSITFSVGVPDSQISLAGLTGQV